MINLLPQAEKKKLLNEFRLRLGIVALCVLFLLEVLLMLLCAPSYLQISTMTKDIESDLANKKAASLPKGNDIQNSLNTIKAEIALLQPDTASVHLPPSQLMNELFSQKPEGVGISSFSYAHSGAAASMQVSGIAATREDLLLFQRLLKENAHFGDVRYAQSFITKKVDISFSLTLTLK